MKGLYTLFIRLRFHLPFFPVTPTHREICRESSSVRLPRKKRQYLWNQPRGSCSCIHPFSCSYEKLLRLNWAYSCGDSGNLRGTCGQVVPPKIAGLVRP